MKIDNDDYCEICFSADDEEEPIVYCDSCNQCFHLTCAHLSENVLQEQQFLCQYCIAGKPICFLCNTNAPFHVFSLFDGFVHTICYRLTSFQYDFDQESQQSNIQMCKEQFVQQHTSDSICQHCDKQGFILDCSYQKCKIFMHPVCFIQSGGAVQVKETNDYELVRVTCKQHYKEVKVNIYLQTIQLLKNNFKGCQNIFKNTSLQHYQQLGIFGKPLIKQIKPEENLENEIQADEKNIINTECDQITLKHIVQEYTANNQFSSNYRQLNAYQYQINKTENLYYQLKQQFKETNLNKCVTLDINGLFCEQIKQKNQHYTLRIGDLVEYKLETISQFCNIGELLSNDQVLQVKSPQQELNELQLNQLLFKGVKMIAVVQKPHQLTKTYIFNQYCNKIQQRKYYSQLFTDETISIIGCLQFDCVYENHRKTISYLK